MGVMSAVLRRNRSEQFLNEASCEALRDATLDDGLKQVVETINSLAELDRRLEGLEGDLIGKGRLNMDRLPSPDDIGLVGFVPRLMEAALLIGAMSRRMHLRIGIIEGAIGMRARPVTDIVVDSVDSTQEAAEAELPAITSEDTPSQACEATEEVTAKAS